MIPSRIDPNRTPGLQNVEAIDKVKAFEIFKGTYPKMKWIYEQKDILKSKYEHAKKLGEQANEIRSQISTFFHFITNFTTDEFYFLIF